MAITRRAARNKFGLTYRNTPRITSALPPHPGERTQQLPRRLARRAVVLLTACALAHHHAHAQVWHIEPVLAVDETWSSNGTLNECALSDLVARMTPASRFDE